MLIEWSKLRLFVLHSVSETEQSERIIFEPLLTTFKAKSIFETAGVVAKHIWSLKPNHHNQVKIVPSLGF